MVHGDHGNGHHNSAPREISISGGMAEDPGLLFLGKPGAPSHLRLSPLLSFVQILNICLFSLFSLFFVLRYIWFPCLMMKTLQDFTESNGLGAIPMGFGTIIVGLVTYYNNKESAIWVAYVAFWISVAMTVGVSMGAVFVMFAKQPAHKLETITGV